MKLARLYTFSATLTAAAALTACGGGDSPVPTIGDLVAPVTVSAAAVPQAKSAFAYLAGTEVTLPKLTLDDGTVVEAGSKLAFTPLPANAPANALTGFTLTNGTEVNEGVLLAGSCIFRITVRNRIPVNPPIDVVVSTCVIDVNTQNVRAESGQQNVEWSLRLGNTTVSGTATVNVTVESGRVTLTRNGTPVGATSVPTGA